MLAVTADHLSYLLRSGRVPALPTTWTSTDARASMRVTSVGTEHPDRLTPNSTQPSRDLTTGRPPQRADLLAGLHALLVPLAFTVRGDRAGIRVELGSWSARIANAPARLAMRTSAIQSVLAGMYPSVDTTPVTDMDFAGLTACGLALGVPTPAPPSAGDRAGPLDRVVRAMCGCHWAVRVLAYPLDDVVVTDAQQNLVNSARKAESAAKAEGGPNPLAERYLELCKEASRSLSDAVATGGWQTAVYLLGDPAGYPRLVAAWRSVFAGQPGLVEAVRVFHVPQVREWAQGWAMPAPEVIPGPDGYRRPFECQTLLSSAELGRYVQLPTCETAGFSVRAEPVFDVEPPRRGPVPVITVGEVVDRGRPLDTRYTVPVADLTKHVFVSGVTGSGKTNTIFTLIENAHDAGAHVLVLEPAKAEYRRLLRHPRIGPAMQVFTLGDETVSPLRLNPFEVEPGTSVQTHIDLLRSLFTASFGMWDPLPQVLERCLFEIYADRGWDVDSDTNVRLTQPVDPDERAEAFPTLSDLVSKAEAVIGELGYEDKIHDNLRASLVARVGALRIGGKGAMLDTHRSTPSDVLFTRPTVVELERLGDDDDKAFVMGLLLIRLAAYRRATGHHDSLAQLLVIEEAHRLLTATPPKSTEFGGDPKTKAVTAFTDLLAEVRTYGLGVVIADQVPVKLAPEVMKNTNLKIAHRLVAEDDRKAVGATMAMVPAPVTALATLRQGHAAVFSEGDDGPLVVHPKDLKGKEKPPPDHVVITHMAGRVDVTDCPAGCPPGAAECRFAARLAEESTLWRTARRALATTLALPDHGSQLWQDVLAAARPSLSRRPTLDENAVWPCMAQRLTRRFAAEQCATAGWTYAVESRLAAALRDALNGRTDRLLAITHESYTRKIDPFPRCAKICGDPPGPCLFRHSTSQQLPVITAEIREICRRPDVAASVHSLASAAARHVVEELGTEDSTETDPEVIMASQATYCLAQQALLANDDLPWREAVTFIDEVLESGVK